MAGGAGSVSSILTVQLLPGIGVAHWCGSVEGGLGLKSKPTSTVKITAAPTPKPGVDLPPKPNTVLISRRFRTFAFPLVIRSVVPFR